MSISQRILVGLLAPVVALAGAAASADAAQGKKGKQPAIATGPMDNGTLDPSWFGEGLEFREDDGEEVDYLWVKPGFTLDGHTLYFKAWPEPEFLGENANERDENDHRLARMMAGDMARTFHDVFKRGLGGKVTTSLESGDVTVEGRIVDCSTGSEAAKVLVGFGAGSGTTPPSTSSSPTPPAESSWRPCTTGS